MRILFFGQNEQNWQNKFFLLDILQQKSSLYGDLCFWLRVGEDPIALSPLEMCAVLITQVIASKRSIQLNIQQKIFHDTIFGNFHHI